MMVIIGASLSEPHIDRDNVPRRGESMYVAACSVCRLNVPENTPIQSTRVLWNTYPVHCCCMKLCETQLVAEEDYKFARTHTFALLTMVIALCTIKHL